MGGFGDGQHWNLTVRVTGINVNSAQHLVSKCRLRPPSDRSYCLSRHESGIIELNLQWGASCCSFDNLNLHDSSLELYVNMETFRSGGKKAAAVRSTSHVKADAQDAGTMQGFWM